MLTRTKIENVDVLPPIEEDEGWSHKGCGWDASPCGELPTHFISTPCPEHGRAHAGDSTTYCQRHYALTLLQIVEVEMPFQSTAFDDLVFDHGAL